MSDSRFSWGDKSTHYNFGKKLFSLKNSPDVLGYCGDVLFASQVLSQLSELDSANMLFLHDSASNDRANSILFHINKQFGAYPQRNFALSYIYHVSRDKTETFHAYKYSYCALTGQWVLDEFPINTARSSLIFADGSGAEEFLGLFRKYQRGDVAGTSRNIFQCFCDSLMHSKISTCGGPPQLVGLYRGTKFNGIPYGIIYEQKRYFGGVQALDMPDYNMVRWYNENFEICDGNTLQRKIDAMRQPNPNT